MGPNWISEMELERFVVSDCMSRMPMSHAKYNLILLMQHLEGGIVSAVFAFCRLHIAGLWSAQLLIFDICIQCNMQSHVLLQVGVGSRLETHRGRNAWKPISRAAKAPYMYYSR